MAIYRWVRSEVVLYFHDLLLEEHGGSSGVRDQGALESALARPQNLVAYASSPSIFNLAAAYAGGISSNHPFVDGNKRSAFLTAYVFLSDNGYELNASDAEATAAMLALAAHEISEDEFAAWLKDHTEEI